jgi:uncharacterized membrane protein YphA (DoxX/SURF4 family)
MTEQQPGQPEPAPTHLYDAAMGISWFALLTFVIVTVIAFVEEMFTKFANAGFGYYFIMLGMPAFCILWLFLLVYASFRPVPTSWPVAALVAAFLIIIGYANIG